MSLEPPAVVILLLLGLAVGSFLNVCIHRLPLRESLISPGSRCPQCGYQLRWFDNIPVISYAMLGARCRKCRTRISFRYPAVEIVTMALFLVHGEIFGWTPLLAVRLLFAAAMVVLFAIDLEHQILPDVITLPGILVGWACAVVFSSGPPGLKSALLGALVGGGALFTIGELWYRLRKIEAMGFGDVKMLAMVGAFLGLKLVILTFILSSFVGGIVGAVLIVSGRGSLASKVPFGTFLALAALVASLWGNSIADWYLSWYV